jgi:hypothetical protein
MVLEHERCSSREKRVELDVESFVLKVAKCKQGSSLMIFNHLYIFTPWQNATEALDSSGIWSMSVFFESITGHEQ